MTASKIDAVSYKIGENGASATGTASVQLDAGPKAGAAHLYIAPGLNVDLTAALLALDTPGLTADTLTLTGDNVTGTLGTVALSGGDLSYTAPASGTADSFTYTVSDQDGGSATANVSVAVNAGLNTSASIALTGKGNVVVGGNGNDTITGGTGGNLVSLGNGNNTVDVAGTDDTIVLGGGTNSVMGTQGMAFIFTGGVGHDTITVGGSGNTIDAVAGINAITGGTGSDTFELPIAGLGLDTITGFTESNGDLLDLRDALVTTSWNGSTATLGHYLKVADSGGNTILSVAPGGAGNAIEIAQLSGVSYGSADLLSHLLL